MARWNACECRFGMPGMTGPDAASISGAQAVPARTSVRSPAAFQASVTLSRQPSGNKARAANKLCFTSESGFNMSSEKYSILSASFDTGLRPYSGRTDFFRNLKKTVHPE
jgi:hypothetical protein